MSWVAFGCETTAQGLVMWLALRAGFSFKWAFALSFAPAFLYATAMVIKEEQAIYALKSVDNILSSFRKKP